MATEGSFHDYFPETRRLTLQFPTSLRLGDSGVIKLSLETEETLASNSLTAESTAQETAGQAATVPNIYQTHNVIAEADADLPGVQTRPSGPVSEPLLPGESITFLWSVRPSEPAMYRGTVWLFLNFVDKVTGARTRLALAAPSVQIQAAGLPRFWLAEEYLAWLELLSMFITPLYVYFFVSLFGLSGLLPAMATFLLTVFVLRVRLAHKARSRRRRHACQVQLTADVRTDAFQAGGAQLPGQHDRLPFLRARQELLVGERRGLERVELDPSDLRADCSGGQKERGARQATACQLRPRHLRLPPGVRVCCE